MNTKRVMWSVLGVGCIGMFCAVVAVAEDPSEKLELCHVPPGDTTAAHTITVSVKAADSHLAKHEGDFLGECASSCDIEDACDDGNMCTSDSCVDGYCVNEVVDCDDGDQCTDNTCDPEMGCMNPDLPVGTACDDGNTCTIGDECVGDAGHLSCRFSDVLALGASCDDGVECSTNDQCVGQPEFASSGFFVCLGFVEDCNCAEFPAPGGIAFAFACDDGNVCTEDGQCEFAELGSRMCQSISLSVCPCGGFCDAETGLCPPGGCESDDDCDPGRPCENGCCFDGPI